MNLQDALKKLEEQAGKLTVLILGNEIFFNYYIFQFFVNIKI